jgi:serine/threonine protein kinase
MWSVGVCCLELLRGKGLEAEKDRNATKLVAENLSKLPNAPFPNLIRGLLETDPDKRLTARQALDSPVFQKYGLKPLPKTFSLVNLKEALPFDNDEGIVPADEKENAAAPIQSKKNKKNRVDPVLSKRFKLIQKICSSMEWTNPMTVQAALTYSIQLSELDDVDDMENSQGLLDCIVLAHKYFERDLSDLEELPEVGGRFESWDVDEYTDNEGTIFMMLDFSLYPRYFLDFC